MTPALAVGKPVVLVLASGAGHRFIASGGKLHKLHAALAGKAVIEHVLESVAASGLTWHLVTGVEGGMGASIAAGVSATASADGWLILPADLPLIQPQSLQHVAAQLLEHAVVVPRSHAIPGHPVGFRKECQGRLLQLNGESGAKPIVEWYRSQGLVCDMPMEDDGIVMDIDTLSDLARIEKLIQTSRRPGDPH